MSWLLKNQNQNKMALSIESTGKYTSSGHHNAELRGLKTAGEAAKIISKKTGKKITAKQIRSSADEWHHSGFYAGKMGKTWFFKDSTIEFLIGWYSAH